MSKRVKLVDLSDTVQAVLVKGTSDNDNPCITVSIYTEASGADIKFSWPLEYETSGIRDDEFEADKTKALIEVFNKTVESNNLPLETIKK